MCFVRNAVLRNARHRFMPADLVLLPLVASRPLTCFRCVELGLPPRLIAIGEPYIEIQSALASSDFVCIDCYQRLCEELES